MQPVASVHLLQEILPSPAALAHAEEREHQRADDEQVVRHHEVFNGLNVADTGKLGARPHVEAKRAGQREQRDKKRIDRYRFIAAELPLIHPEAHDGLEDRDERRDSSETHKHEEERGE